MSSTLGNLLQNFQVSDLHGSFRIQNVGGLMHEFGAFDIGLCTDDFGFGEPLGFGGHGEISLKFL